MVLQTESGNIPLPETVMRLEHARNKIEKPVDPNPQEMENLKRQFPCEYPVNPHMKHFNARLQTFDQRWPIQKGNATPQHIAKAGFYFLGERDRAKCWYCNGGLQNWKPNDEPFTEHAKWFPGCEFVLQCKGVEFVKQIVSKFPNLQRPALRNPRFDHKTLKLIPEEPRRDQQQPLLVDPQANNSAGEVLRGYSPSSSRSQNQTNESKKSEAQLSELEKKAIEMGFELPVVQKIIQNRIKKTKKNYKNIYELIEVLISCDDESMQDVQDESKPQLIHIKSNFEENSHETQFQGEGLYLVAASPSQSLKRSNEQRSEPEHSQKSSDVDTPMKRCKTEKTDEEEYLYCNRKLLNLDLNELSEWCSEELPWSFPMYPDMEDFNARLHTFDQSSWSQRAKATPQEIANAGFYCADDDGNLLTCYYCGGEIQNWSPNDEPFTEHAKRFSACEFLHRTKGNDFIKQAVHHYYKLPQQSSQNTSFKLQLDDCIELLLTHTREPSSSDKSSESSESSLTKDNTKMVPGLMRYLCGRISQSDRHSSTSTEAYWQNEASRLDDQQLV